MIAPILPAAAPLLLVTTAHPSLYQHPGPDGEPVHPQLGRLLTPRHTSSARATAEAGIPWACDNDCFQGLDERRYVAMLDLVAGLPGCRFVTVPDVVADAAATAASFERWLPELRRRDLPVGLVLQDGQADVPVPWDDVDAVFVGGSTEWKLSDEAADLAGDAVLRGKWAHWGRVNTAGRIKHVCETGAADSIDGSQWARWRKTHLPWGLDLLAGWAELAALARPDYATLDTRVSAR